MNIVLVHGFISTGKIFFFIKKKLEAQGHICFTPTLKPIDAKYGIEDLAIKLKDYIENNLEADSNFVLVGFSMGAIICRYYLRPNSTFLKNLETKEYLLKNLNSFSYRTPFDLMIIPNKSSIWERATNKIFISIMHSSMLINSKLVREIIREL